jgi:hypothetical protein
MGSRYTPAQRIAYEAQKRQKEQDEITKAIQASISTSQQDNFARLANDSVVIKSILMPMKTLPPEAQIRYEEYIEQSDVILLPAKYCELVYQNFGDVGKSDLNVFKINMLGEPNICQYGTFFEFYDNPEAPQEIIYVSNNIFNYFKQYNEMIDYGLEFQLTLQNYKLVKANKVELIPQDWQFLKVKDQLKLFENIIGNKHRILFVNQKISIYSKEIYERLNFTVSNINESIVDNDIIGIAIDTDLEIDFKPSEETIKKYTNYLDEEKRKKEKEYEEKRQKFEDFKAKFGNGKISTKTKQNDESNINMSCDDSEDEEDENEKPLSREELRQKRLEFYKKQGLIKK